MHTYPKHTDRNRDMEKKVRERGRDGDRDGDRESEAVRELLLIYLKLVQLSLVNLADTQEEISYNCKRVRALMYASKSLIDRKGSRGVGRRE